LVIQHRKLFQNLSAGDRTKLLRTVKNVAAYERDSLLFMVTPLVEEFPQLSEKARSSVLFFLTKCPETTLYRPESNEARALSVGYLRKTLSSTEGVMTKKHADEAMRLFWAVANRRTHEIDPDFALDQYALLLQSIDWNRDMGWPGTARSECERDSFQSTIEMSIGIEDVDDFSPRGDRQGTIDFFRDCLAQSSAALAPSLIPELSVRERVEIWRIGGMLFNHLPTEQVTFIFEQFHRFSGVLSGANYTENDMRKLLQDFFSLMTGRGDISLDEARFSVDRALTFFRLKALLEEFLSIEFVTFFSPF
ncbi:hypothetical protein OAN21_02915, partial [Alphaproteobacteria bacterium]|nr:hypothetical protein [Alphaproteobacteria bacterium]